MNNLGNYDSLIAHLHDLKEKSARWHKSTCSAFLTEEEQAIVQKIFTPSRFVRYDGGLKKMRFISIHLNIWLILSKII